MLDIIFLNFCPMSKFLFFIQMYFIICLVYGYLVRVVLQRIRKQKIKYSDGLFFILLWPLSLFIIVFMFIYLFIKLSVEKLRGKYVRR